MSSSDLIRWGAIGFMLGGVVWVVVGILDASRDPFTFPGPVAFLLLIVALLLSALGLVGLHALQEGSYGRIGGYGRIGLAGFYTALVAIAVQILGAVGLLWGSGALGWLVAPVGSSAKLVGFVLYGAATVQARVLPRWYGVLLIVFMPISAALGAYGNIWVGLVSLVLGYVLWLWRGEVAQQPRRVSSRRVS